MIEENYHKIVKELSEEIISIRPGDIIEIKLNPLEITENDDDK
ncbi:hypothetical protein P4V74_30270 [Bacillus thuringiensis]|nr:hypothetical protein [Bacillus thuringiensis]